MLQENLQNALSNSINPLPPAALSHNLRAHVKNESTTSAVGLDLFAWVFTDILVEICCVVLSRGHILDWCCWAVRTTPLSFSSYVIPVAEVSNHFSRLTREQTLKMLFVSPDLGTISPGASLNWVRPKKSGMLLNSASSVLVYRP